MIHAAAGRLRARKARQKKRDEQEWIFIRL
jgi:hypothetical protein